LRLQDFLLDFFPSFFFRIIVDINSDIRAQQKATEETSRKKAEKHLSFMTFLSSLIYYPFSSNVLLLVHVSDMFSPFLTKI